MAHFKDKDPETGRPTKTIHLIEPPEGSPEKSYLEQISPFVHVKSDREKASIYQKIELFWPHQLLEVVINQLVLLLIYMQWTEWKPPATK